MDTCISKGKSTKIKYIAVIMMIILHLFQNPSREYISLMKINGCPIENIIVKFCSLCVGIFVFLSGYGMAKKYNEGVTYKAIFKKIVKFYINYWFIFLLFIPIGIAMGIIKFDLKRIVLNFLAIESDYNYEWWFVALYVQLLLIFPILNKCLNIVKVKQKNLEVYIISLIISIVAKGIYKIYIENALIRLFLPIFIYQFVFINGIIISKNGIFNIIQKKITLNNKMKMKLFLLMLSLIMTIMGCIPILGKIINPILTPVWIYFLAQVIREPKSVKIYKSSTNVWLIHTFFTTYYFPDVIWNVKYSGLIVIWTVILTTFIGMILDRILEQINRALNI